MKKFFSICALALALVFATTSCDPTSNNNGLSFVYSVAATGDADGNVDIIFPNGDFNVNGTAALNFRWGNDTTSTKALATAKCSTLEDALVSNDAQLQAFASALDSSFNVVAASGTYYVRIAGYAKEQVTGAVIAFDKEWTNRSNEE